MPDNEMIEILAKLDAYEASLVADISKANATLKVIRMMQEMVRPLAQDEPAEFAGLADTIRTILRGSEKSFSTTEIRDRLVAIGYDKPHTNLMASIHSVLKRMETSTANEVKSKTRKDGTTAYFWTGERSMGDLIASFGDGLKVGGLAGLLGEQKAITSDFAEALRRTYQERDNKLKAAMKGLAPKPPTPIKTGSIRIPANRKSESED